MHLNVLDGLCVSVNAQVNLESVGVYLASSQYILMHMCVVSLMGNYRNMIEIELNNGFSVTMLLALMADLCLPLSAGEDTFELHSVQLELEERRIDNCLGSRPS